MNPALGQVYRSREPLSVTCWWWIDTVAILDDYSMNCPGTLPAGECFTITEVSDAEPRRILCTPQRLRDLKPTLFPKAARKWLFPRCLGHQIEISTEAILSKCDLIDAPHLQKHRWFQFHLSTAVVMMLFAGLLLVANLTCNLFYEWHHIDNITGQGASYYGFPLCCYSTSGLSYDPASHWNTRALYATFNLLFALGVLLGVSALSEFIIRKREVNQRWFQLHLSTLVLLTFSAGGVMGANFRFHERVRSVESYGETGELHVRYWGWPWVAAYDCKYPPLGNEMAPEIGSMDRYNESGYLAERVIGDVLSYGAFSQ